MTNGVETADAHQALAIALDKVSNARRDLVRGLPELIAAADELGLDWAVDDIRHTAGSVMIETNGIALVRSQLVGCLSNRIRQHRTHETGRE